MTATKRKHRPVRKHYRSRAQRQVNALFMWRHSAVRDGEGQYGWLMPVEVASRELVIDLALFAPQVWHVMAIVYCETPEGEEYRQFAEIRSDQQFIAQDVETGEDYLAPVLKAAMKEAEKGVNSGQIKARALVMRPWSRARSSMTPVMQRLKGPLGLSTDEVDWDST